MYDKLLGEIKKSVAEQYGDGYEVHLYEIITPGGCSIPSIAVRTPSDSICPAIHIGHLLCPMGCGLQEPEDAAAEFMDLYSRIDDISQYTQCIPHIDHSYVLDTVTYRLVNLQKGSPHLSRLPHRELPGLSAVYTVPVGINGSSDEYIIVDNALCERLSLGTEELQESAEIHTEFKGFRMKPYVPCQPEMPDAETGCSGLWILTSRNGTNGATVLLYPYYLKRLCGKLKKDLYLVASSRDRVIAAPVEKGADLHSLRAMADRINSSFGPEKFLTDTIYRFRRRGGTLEIAQEVRPD